MSDNIVERPIVPYNPAQSKVKQKDIYNLYAPVAGQGKIGMAGYNPAEFNVKDQIVYLSENFKSGYLSKIDVTKTLPQSIVFDVNGIKTPNVWYYNCQYSVSDKTIHTVTGALLVVRSEQRDERNYTQFETLLAEERVYTRKLVVTNGQISSPTTFRALLSFDDWTDFTNELEALELKKLDKQTMSSGQYRAYVVTPDGNQGTIGIINGSVSSAEQLANNIARYDSFGRLATSMPTENQHATNKQYVDAADENLSNEIETLRQDIDSKSHFRGYLTTAEIQSLLNPDNGDYAWSSDTLTVWSYNGSAWVNTGNPVPDQTVPKGDSIPLPDAATGSAGASTSYAGIDHVHPQSAIYESASAANAKWQAQGQVNQTILNTIEDVTTSLAGVIGEALSDIPLSPEQTGAAITGENTLAGASVSVALESRNLFNIDAWDGTSIQTGGYIQNTITLSDGVFTNPISQYNDFYSPNIQIPVKKGKVTVSADVQCPEEGYLQFSFGFSGPRETTASTEYKALTAEDTEWHNYQVTFDVEKDGICYFGCANRTAITGENYSVNFRNVQVELGETATPYTPYITDGTSVNVTACGGNIYNPVESYTTAGSNCTKSEDGYGYTRSSMDAGAALNVGTNQNPVSWVKGKTITFSCEVDVDGQYIGLSFYGANGWIVNAFTSSVNKKVTVTTTVPEGTTYVAITIASGNTVTTIMSNIMVNYGNETVAFSPYTGATYPATVGQSVEIVQYDKITNVFTDNSGVTVSAAFKQSTRYELDTKPVSLAGTYAERPTGTYPYVVLYTATDRDGETYRLEANTDGSVSANWVQINGIYQHNIVMSQATGPFFFGYNTQSG